MSNQDIRQRAKDAGVALWRIADELSVCEMTLTRRMRREMPTTEKENIFAIIDRLSSSANREAGVR